jgi:hypothetical protein
MPDNVDRSVKDRSERLASLHDAVEEHISAVHSAALDHLRRHGEGSGTTAVTITIEARTSDLKVAHDDIGGQQCWQATYPCGSMANGGTITCTVTVCDEIGPVTVLQ